MNKKQRNKKSYKIVKLKRYNFKRNIFKRKHKQNKFSNKFININFCSKIIFILSLLLFNIIILTFNTSNSNETVDNFGLSFEQKIKNYQNKRFSIIRRLECTNCGFFSLYMVYLGCILKYVTEGRIPIVDLQSYQNVYNKGNSLKKNPWELFFYQPYNYTLDEVKKYANHAKYSHCTSGFYRPNERNIYNRTDKIAYWHNFSNTYIPVRNEIMNEAKIIMKELFGNSRNILGVKVRGTDYVTRKSFRHSIQPQIEQVIFDVKEMDSKYNYDFIFFSTEDELIKNKFVPEFKNKIKLLNPNITLEYNFKKRTMINSYPKINGNLDYLKNYILNIIILSKCLDLVTSRCNGAAAIFIISNGFRHTKVYDLGEY